ncbi:DNA primase [Nocardiopsis sp. MG754419]|uniref:DNA primase n=1 Tax=Nocardiopsis sp. MG754419 TaxID=2259865 RepID=UPI001BAC8905|nr:DNA primase [Nocardiopsis sp. MG754419]MBR8745200.1 DNA primase [Nocardiopsis sp. MG754419]
MRRTRSITARRVLQGSAAFVGFGALSLAAAMPAQADTVLYGSATASVYGQETYLEGTPQGEEGAAGDHFAVEAETFLTLDAETDVRVDAAGVHSTVTVNSAHARLTLEDVLGIIDATDTEQLSSEGDVTTFAADETVETLDESDLLIDVEFTGASVSVTKAWDGTHTTDFVEGTVQENVNELDLGISVLHEVGEGEFEDRFSEDVVWDGAFNLLYTEFDAGELGGIDFYLAEAVAATTDGDLGGDDGDGGGDDGGEDGGDDDAGEGDGGGDEDAGEGDGDPGEDGKEHDKGDGDQAEEGKDGKDQGKDEDLARTGSPIAALIGAGAALAAGGGAAAYLARRRKKNNEAAEETDES